MKTFIAPLFAACLLALPATAEEQPSLPDIVAQAVGTANEGGFNPISLDADTRAKASLAGQIATSVVAGFGCPEAANAVATWSGIALQIAE